MSEPKFGDYCLIEQKRHFSGNEMYIHKVINSNWNSNMWVDIPVQTPATETMHGESESVISCICCGVDETEVRRYRTEDLALTGDHMLVMKAVVRRIK